MGAKLNMENVASTRNHNDEEDDDEEQEDVVFEQSYTTEKNKHKQSNSVKANGHVKEYKEIVWIIKKKKNAYILFIHT